MQQWTRRRTFTILLSPVALLIISATRLLIVGNYNTTTAQAIASSGGYVNTLLGTIMPLVPIGLPYLAVLFLIYRRFLLSALSFAAAICVSPTRLAPLTSRRALHNALDGYLTWIQTHGKVIGVTFAVLLVFGLYVTKEIRSSFRAEVVKSYRTSGKSVHEAAHEHGVAEGDLRSWAHGGTGSVALALVLVVAASALLLPYFWYIYPVPRTLSYYKALVAQPWLPPERITAGSGAPLVGYVLSASDTWVTILDARTRTIRYDRADQVTGRLVCQLNSDGLTGLANSALFPLFKAKTSQLPPCFSQGARPNSNTMPQAVASESTATSETTSSGNFQPFESLSPLKVCASNLADATLSVELSGSPAGFRIQVDGGPFMGPGPVRFVPAGTLDSFSFTFAKALRPSGSSDHHTFVVEWRSPTHAATTLRRATLVLQYQAGSAGC
jgi:hypothetical protein